MPRPRLVWPADMVAHLWNAQKPEQPEARNASRNFSFQGVFLRSYSTSIARIVGNDVLILHHRFSSTTDRHQRLAVNASCNRRQFHVRDIGSTSSGADHRRNVADYVDRISAAAQSLMRARVGIDYRYASLRRLIEEANRYIATFAASTPVISLPAIMDLDRLEATRQREASRASMAAERARVAQEAQRAAMEAREPLSRLVREDFAAALAMWRRGEWPLDRWELFSRAPASSGDFMRIDGEEVHTSRGAVVPLDHVRRALRLLGRFVLSGVAWSANGTTVDVGHFQITAIDADGTTGVGCHTFRRAEIEYIADAVALKVGVDQDDDQTVPAEPDADRLPVA